MSVASLTAMRFTLSDIFHLMALTVSTMFFHWNLWQSTMPYNNSTQRINNIYKKPLLESVYTYCDHAI